jgi:RNA polymerase-binding transcription factor DksA
MTMNSGARDDLTRARLAELRRSASRRVVDLEGDFEAIVDAATDVATDDEHDPEGHTIAWERQQLAALVVDSRRALAEIEAAQQRLDSGRYGRCTNCGRPIAAERLDALPATPTCLGCAERSSS